MDILQTKQWTDSFSTDSSITEITASHSLSLIIKIVCFNFKVTFAPKCIKVLPFSVQFCIPESRSWLISVFFTAECRAGLMSQLASWPEINTYIHLVSRREQRCSCPCSLIRSRNSSRLSDKLRSDRNITQNSWIQCLEVRDDTDVTAAQKSRYKSCT